MLGGAAVDYYQQESQESDDIFNAADFFIRQCNLNINREAKTVFYNNNKIYTYAELEAIVNKYSCKFLDMGLKKKQRIGILLSDMPQFIFAFWGAIQVGVVPVLINVKLSKEDIIYIINESEIKLLITEKQFETIIDLSENAPLEKIILVKHLEMLTENSTNIQSLPKITTTRDEVAFWIYTSGSNGRPKGVMHRHGSMAKCVDYYGRKTLGLNENDIVYSVSKMAHSYGLGNTTFHTLAVGAASVISNGETAFEVVETINKYKPTVFFAVPSVYASLLRIGDIEQICTESIRLCVSAGEVLPKSLWYRWKERFGLEIIDGMGTTESLTTFISNPIGAVRPGSTGKLVYGFDAKIVDEENKLVPNGIVGDLLVSGDTFMQGYWCSEENQKRMVGTYFKTGDKFYMDESGYFWYAGRSIDVFKVNGRWVKASEIENILLDYTKIKETVVISEISENETTKIIAYIVIDNAIEASQELAEDIKRYVKSKLEHFKCPARIHFVTGIPKGPTSKIRRVKLREELIIFTV